MSRILVDIQLIVLIVDDEASPLLANCEVWFVLLLQPVGVIFVRELGLHLHRLSAQMRPPDGVRVRPVTFLTTLPQPCLCLAPVVLKVVVNNVKVLEFRELAIWREGTFDEKFEFLGVARQPVPGVEADLLTNAGNHALHLGLEIGGVVYDVEVGMTDPRRCGLRIQLLGKFYSFRSTSVILEYKRRELNNWKIHEIKSSWGLPWVEFESIILFIW